MRLRVVAHFLGTLVIFLGVAHVLPFLWSVTHAEPEATSFLLSGLISVALGLFLRRIGTAPTSVTIKEGFAVVSLGWLSAALLGAIPFLLTGATSAPVDAFFESMSGFTTTGATIFADVEALPHGILFWRSFSHWLGGMGIIALFVAILPRLGAGGMNLLRAEVPGPSPERMTPRIADTARLLWTIYLGFTALQIVLLLVAGLSLFDSMTHTFATLATGGFSTRNASVAGLQNGAAEGIILVFMLIAGGNFALYYGALRGDWRGLWGDREYRFYLSFVGIGTLAIGIALWFGAGVHSLSALRKAVFQVVSIITTTGFTTADFGAWPQFARVVLLLMMLVGGCRGSTAGAAKQIRLMVVLKYGYRELHRVLHPQAVIPLRLGNETVPERTVTSILGFIFLYLSLLGGASILLAAMGIDLVSAFSASAASLGNVGPGLGIVGPMQTYGPLPAAGKLLLSFLMLLGRLEIYTVLVLFLPEFAESRNRTSIW